jgi:hypothetical protein
MRLFSRLLKRSVRITYHLWYQATGRGPECGLKTNLEYSKIDPSGWSSCVCALEVQSQVDPKSKDALTLRIYGSMFPDDLNLLKVSEDRIKLVSRFLFQRSDAQDQDHWAQFKQRSGYPLLTNQERLKSSAIKYRLEVERSAYSTN